MKERIEELKKQIAALEAAQAATNSVEVSNIRGWVATPQAAAAQVDKRKEEKLLNAVADLIIKTIDDNPDTGYTIQLIPPALHAYCELRDKIEPYSYYKQP